MRDLFASIAVILAVTFTAAYFMDKEYYPCCPPVYWKQ